MTQQKPHPTFWKAIRRGLGRRCPRCGGRNLFATRWRLRPRCPDCQMRLEREEGAFLGSMTLNYAVTAVAGIAYMVPILIFARGAPLWLLITGGVAVLAIVPALFYPTSKTLWAALDLLAFRLEHEEQA